MSFISRNLVLLRWHLVLAVLVALAGIGAVAGSLHFRDAAEERHRQAAAQQQEARGRMARATDEGAEMRQGIGRFRAMAARGLIGDERRLEWLEAIARIKERRHLAEMDFELSPRHALEATQATPELSHEFMASTMKLRLPLLHENDLLGFLDDLAADAQALVLVRRCDVQRLTPAIAESGATPRLLAECQLEWITVRMRQQ